MRLSRLRPLVRVTVVLIALGGLSVLADERLPDEMPVITIEAGDSSKVGGDAPKVAEKKAEAPPSFWEKNPPVRPLPRIGNFSIPPKGPGYYSLRDLITGNYRENPPKFPYPPHALMQLSFYEADFRYLESPKNTQHDWADVLHRIHFCDGWMFSTGGEVWFRHMHENNSRLLGANVDYDLFRTRVYGDLWYCNMFRVYVEFLDAHVYNHDLVPLAIDEDRSDLLNAFVDLKVGEYDGHPAYVRVGRQEMLFGSQRLISPLAWANSRRTFQGVRGFYLGEKWDVDVFWTQPVIPQPSHFDSVDNNINFAGLWTTYRPEKTRSVDAYYLFLDNTSKITRQGIDTGPFSVHTIGSRYSGEKNNYLWDLEGMVQVGERGSEGIIAGAATAGGGYHFPCAAWNPTFWTYYDFASGDQSPGKTGTYSTFNQIFPFGHYYLGWVDQVGRQNIHDLNAHLLLYPAPWITMWMQYHHFWLASKKDALYNAAGIPIRRDPTGRAGHNVGDEFDLVLNFHLGPHSDILTGYSVLFPGHFLRNTGADSNTELYYVSYVFRW